MKPSRARPTNLGRLILRLTLDPNVRSVVPAPHLKWSTARTKDGVLGAARLRLHAGLPPTTG